jgi:hypothetical protein
VTVYIALTETWEVEAILDEKEELVNNRMVKLHLIKWKGFTDADNSWEPETNFAQ